MQYELFAWTFSSNTETSVSIYSENLYVTAQDCSFCLTQVRSPVLPPSKPAINCTWGFNVQLICQQRFNVCCMCLCHQHWQKFVLLPLCNHVLELICSLA
ncbi:hypothetical protein XENOCAPTIV_010205 [Xenoophorus captivus]|uniref:SWIM-type domain-containing protein n=1 Tax=Xenoophorus captivus TaxID=1517983 RepID=A0ABV0QU05_9TELE